MKNIITIIASFLLFFSLSAQAGEIKEIAFPLIFDDRTNFNEKINLPPIKTSACFPVKERTINLPWNDFVQNAQSVHDKSLVKLIDAVKKKDINALRAVLYPFAEDIIQEQSNHFFQQFETVELGTVERFYDFGDLVIYFINVEYDSHSFSAPFAFAQTDGNLPGFLLKRSSIPIDFLESWYNSPWGPNSDTPSYCSPSRPYTHEMPLDGIIKEKYGRQSSLTFTSSKLPDLSLTASSPYSRLLETYISMMNALEDSKMEAFAAHLTNPESITSWFGAASGKEKSRSFDHYKNTYSAKPLYILNANPLFVLYTTGQSHESILYFLKNNDGLFKQAKFNHVDFSYDPLFKNDKMRTEVQKPESFKEWKIERDN